MKILNNKLVVLLIIVILILFPTNSYALSDIISDGNDFLGAGQGQDEIIDETKLNEISDSVYNILLIIAIVIAVGVGTFLGIQLMLQGAEGKAQIKEALVPYVVGCIVAFGAFGIWRLVVLIAQNLLF